MDLVTITDAYRVKTNDWNDWSDWNDWIDWNDWSDGNDKELKPSMSEPMNSFLSYSLNDKVDSEWSEGLKTSSSR